MNIQKLFAASIICAFSSIISLPVTAQNTSAPKNPQSLMIPKSLFYQEKDTLEKPAPQIKPAEKPADKPAQTVIKNPVSTDKNISLSDYMKSFQLDYLTAFMSALNALNEPKIQISSFDADSGEINAVYNHSKGLYITVIPETDKTSTVKITPFDGIYSDMPDGLTDGIFDRMKKKGMK